MPDEPKPGRLRRWWIWGGIGLLVLAALFELPGLLASSRASNHRNASASLKTLASAEQDFRANDRDDNKVNDFWVGDVSGLHYLEARGEPIRLIERSVANADGAPRKPVAGQLAKVGYRFAAIPTDESGAPYDRGGGRNVSRFAFCAYPEEYLSRTWHRREGYECVLTFIINEENVMWRKDTAGKPVSRWPKDLLVEGWSKLD